MNNNSTTRRDAIKHLTLSMAGLALPSLAFSQNNDDRKLNVALVGLGRYAGYLAEGIKESKHCKAAGIVTGTPSKIPEWRSKYEIEANNVYNYENFDKIKNNPDIDVVYVVLPNAMHKEFAIKAAMAGKHVIVEKPMATNAADCLEIINACKAAGVQLAVGYRLHFEPYNMELMRLGQQEVFGKVKIVEASLGYNLDGSKPDDWHFNKKLSGGGALQNLGVYCIQAARYIIGKEPVSVNASFGPVTHKNLFTEVEESVFWRMEFPDGAVATSSTTYNCGIDRVYAAAENGFFELSPAISYGPFKGRTSNGELNFPEINQQQTQMDAIATYLLAGQQLPMHISGEEGYKDLKVIDAIYKSAETGRTVVV